LLYHSFDLTHGVVVRTAGILLNSAYAYEGFVKAGQSNALFRVVINT
jgi:hypothetical protein